MRALFLRCLSAAAISSVLCVPANSAMAQANPTVPVTTPGQNPQVPQLPQQLQPPTGGLTQPVNKRSAKDSLAAIAAATARRTRDSVLRARDSVQMDSVGRA